MASASKRIGATVYEVAKPLASEGLQFSLRVGKWAFPFIGLLTASGGDPAAVTAAVGQVLATLSGEEVEYLNTTLGKLTTYTDDVDPGRSPRLDKAHFDTHFQDRFDEWIQWVIFGIQTVSGSFFNGAMGFGALLKSAAPSAPPSMPSSSKSPNPVERTG